MPETTQGRIRPSFWNKILKEDIRKQANVVEFMGIVGLILFVVLGGALWTVRIDITVPTYEASLIGETSLGTLIKAKVPHAFASFLQKGQEAQIAFVFSDKTTVKTTGTVIEVGESSANIPLTIVVRPNLDVQPHGILKEQPKDIRMRIGVEKKRFVDLFIEKVDTKGNYDVEE